MSLKVKKEKIYILLDKKTDSENLNHFFIIAINVYKTLMA